MAGRKPKLNEEITNQICGAIVQGATLESAAASASVSVRSVTRWLQKGREEDAEELYANFAAEVEEATNRSELSRVVKILQADDWRAHAWWLARRFPERWSEKRSIEVSTNDRPDGAAMVASMLSQLRAEHDEGGDDE
jgi:transposase